ncbi:MAG: alpha/beta fold hydrolase [Acidimicrobiales bacterium]
MTPAIHQFGGDGPTLLLAHATGFHAKVFEPLTRHLTDAFHCVGLDFRGHGDTPAPADDAVTWSGFGEDVLAVVDALDRPTPLYGLGHSMGGAALLMAEQLRPGTFAALYCYEPIVIDTDGRPGATSVEDHPLAVGARRRREVFADRDEAYANYASKPPLGAIDPDVLRAYVDHGFADQPDGTVRLKCRGAHEAAVYATSTSHDTFGALGQVTCPVVVAAGRADEGPGGFAPAVAEAMTTATFERHDHLGHFGPFEEPGFVAERAREAFA